MTALINKKTHKKRADPSEAKEARFVLLFLSYEFRTYDAPEPKLRKMSSLEIAILRIKRRRFPITERWS